MDELEKQEELNRSLQEENQLLRNRLQLQTESYDLSSSLVESLKETLGIRTRQTTSEQNLLQVNKDINKAIFNQKSGLSDISTVSKQIAKNNDLIAKSLVQEQSLTNQISGTDKNRVIQANIKQKALDNQNKDLSRLMSMSKEDRDLRKDEISSLQNKIAKNEQYLSTSLKNMSVSAQQLLYTQQQRQELEKQNKERGKEKDTLKAIDERLGAAGRFTELIGTIPGLGKYANNALAEVTQQIKDAAENGEELPTRMQALGMITKSVGAQIKNFLTDPFAVILFMVKELLAALKLSDKATGELAKSMGTSYAEASAMRQELGNIAGLSFDANINAQNLQKSMMALNKEFGTATMMSGELLKDYTRLTEVAGYSAEAAAGLSRITVATGTDLSENTEEILGQAMAFNATNKLALNEKEIVEGVAKASKATTLTLGMNPGKIAQAVAQSKALGLELSKVESIASSLLDFESSISNELEAELLTGRDLNLETARLAALNGDIATVAKEINKQVGSAADFTKMNVIQQEALAKSVGMTREDLAGSLIEQEALTKLGVKDAAAAKEKFDKLVAQYGYERAVKELGDEKYGQQLKSQSIQERFNATVEKLRETFVQVADAINMVISPIVDILMPILSIIQGIVGGIATAFGWVGEKIGKIIPSLGIFGSILKYAAKIAVLIAAYKAYASLATIPIIGVGLGAAAAATVTATGFSFLNGISKGNDVVSQGYGKRTLLAGKDAIALNDEDTVIAGTDLMGNKKDKKGDKESTQTSTPPSIDLTPLIDRMSAVEGVLQQILAKETNIYLDSTKVGTGFAVASSKVQ